MSSEKETTFGSTDFIEDAVDSLQKSDFFYVVLTGISPHCTRVNTNLPRDSDSAMRLVRALRDHFSLEVVIPEDE